MIHDALAALVDVVPPPEPEARRFHGMTPAPLPDSGGDRFDWDGLAARTSWRYPADYRRFLETYGAGGLICAAFHTTGDGHRSYFQGGCPSGHQLDVFSPPPIGVENRAVRHAARWPGDGRKRWGGGGECLAFSWCCADPDPDRWTVEVSRFGEDDPRETVVRELDMGMVETLLALVTGRLDLGPDLTLPGPAVFEGWRAHELRFREEYPDYRTWDDPLPARSHDA